MNENCYVFDLGAEKQRLHLQNQVLREYELAAYQTLWRGRQGLSVLDIGCNDGSKSVSRFGEGAFEKVIGLDCSASLAQAAQRQYGDARFAFYACNVEVEGWEAQLRDIMQQHDIAAFDVIYLSFVLMHLQNPTALLAALRRRLAPDGRLIIVEIDDALAYLRPDPQGRFQTFLRLLEEDPLAGDRHFAAKVPALLRRAGYAQQECRDCCVKANGTLPQTKKDLFTVFCSYLPEDVCLLCARENSLPAYQEWSLWLRQNYSALQQSAERPDTELSMGVRISISGVSHDGL